MSDELGRFEQAVAELTAPGQAFELDELQVGGVVFRNYARLPASLGQYFLLMRQHAAKEFVVYRNERYSYGEAYAMAAALANALQQRFGVVKGDRVAILSRNNPQWMIGFIAATAIGAVAVPMNAWWTTEELDYGVGDCGASVVIADRSRAERLQPISTRHGLRVIAVEDCSDLALDIEHFADLVQAFEGQPMPEVDVALEDNATIMYTSGSTGHPKGALSTHRGILSTLFSWALYATAGKIAEARSAQDAAGTYPPAALLTIPLFHCTASHSLFLLSLMAGRKIVIMYKWDVQEALRLIEAERITFFNGVPTMSAELQAAAAQSDRDLSSLEDISAGGAARPPEQVKKIAGTFHRARPGLGYGLTETNAIGALNAGALYLARPGSTGRVVPAVTELRIVDVQGRPLPAGERGELCVKSPANCVGYWNKPAATAEAFVDGWFHTGDVAYLDEEGFLFIVDRIKDIIIRGGENISCLEVEAAIDAHPAVVEVAVFGLPDERLGEIVGAAVVLRHGETLQAETLRAWLAGHLAAFKIPAHIWFRDGPLPRIASGKIFKRQLKADYAAQLASTGE